MLLFCFFFFFQAEDGIRDAQESRGLGDVYKRQELDIATQRVNLFEKVKIPEAEENIRLIKIYIGDQLSNAVGRSKIAKRKIEALSLEEIVVWLLRWRE